MVQAGFFTPSRKGQIWDTWAYFHEGRYYLYYLAGTFNSWDGHELAPCGFGFAESKDGIAWIRASANRGGYVDDYLMNLKRVSYNGRIGFMVDDLQGAFKDISVWQSK